jgi:hypothetical protein
MSISISDHVKQKQSLVVIDGHPYGEDMSTRNITNSQLERMAWTISNAGFGSISASAIRELGFEARRAGVQPSIAGTLVDDAVPLVVRQRAFGHIATKLAGARSHTSDSSGSRAA